MNELYWITRFNYIHILCNILMIFGFIISLIYIIAYYVNNGQAIFEGSRDREIYAKEYKSYAKICLKGLKYTIPLTILFTILFVFVPNTKDALLIYGVGGTIDYIQSNPTAQKLPDKCVQALDKWVDSWNKEKKDTTDNQ